MKDYYAYVEKSDLGLFIISSIQIFHLQSVQFGQDPSKIPHFHFKFTALCSDY